MASYDLTPKLAEHLDRHLALCLVNFLFTTKLYSSEELLQVKYNLLKETKLVDVAIDTYKELHGTKDTPKELLQKRMNVLDELAALDAKAKPFLSIFEKPEVIQNFKNDKSHNLQMLKEKYEFKDEHIPILFDYAKFTFEIYKYPNAADLLYFFKLLSQDFDKNLEATWGKLASEILTTNWETAMEELYRLREMIDGRAGLTAVQQVQLRTWIIHWSLFVFFNHSKGRDGMVDLFFSPPYLNTIQTACPHILRYLTAAVITNKRRRSMLKELVKVIQQELYAYHDPTTDFVNSLFTDFDFDAAQIHLSECEQVLRNDYFLSANCDDFIENARFLMFECYCRIHQRIDIRYLSQKLNMTEEAGERWIVNLIRNARLDAKIDSQARTVVMGTQHKSVYQDVIEKSKDLSFRCHVMSSNIDKKEKELAYRVNHPVSLNK